ncbi:hypothetical protein [Botrimarina sp.]|uniref:hypothetical protein n=1 Tax=Botrimarina sp. TaxID=2795802 RepID=UPI0032EDDB9B
MRAIVALLVVILVLALIGWISFSADSDRPSATIETEKIEQDIEEMGAAARAAGDDLRRAAGDAADELERQQTDDDDAGGDPDGDPDDSPDDDTAESSDPPAEEGPLREREAVEVE